ncbi:MAG: Ig-like domain-containing protein [Myxococcales bacterium]|nr:Ig-like domain-containing protein [Myxococcales bacterium]
MSRSLAFRAGLYGLVAPSLLALSLCSTRAEANGQSTHLWISHDALTHVPEGPLLDFLSRPELRKMLDNGTMFPDGGYPLGDPYAEIAHWEPFQQAYLDWIMATYDPPYEGEAAEHLAFFFGMASHGMADQTFDSLYGERVKVYDGAIGDFDTASDIIMMSNFEPAYAPSDWVPYELFDQLYSSEANYDVDPATMMQGQNLLRIAVNSVAALSQLPDKVADVSVPFPWGSQHLLDETVPGSPPCEGEVVARYWRVLWAIAHEQALPGPVLATIPADGGANHPTDSSSIESWISVAFARGLVASPLSAEDVTLQAEGGEIVPVSFWHYYGATSHIVHLQPQQDLAADTIYTVTIQPGVESIHGDALAGYSFRFSTGAEGPPPTVPEWPADHDPQPDMGTDTGETDTGDTTETGSADTTDTTGTADNGDDVDGDSTGAGADAGTGGSGGCACSQTPNTRGGGASTLLLLLAVGFRFRSRTKAA